MLLKRDALLATLPATTANDSRYPGLDAIRIDPAAHTYITTNGHVLIRVTDTEPVPDAEFPTPPAAPFDHDPTAPILLSADVARQVSKALPKRTTSPVLGTAQLRLGTAQLSMNGDPTTATLVVTDLETPQIRTIKLDDRTFPETDRLWQLPHNAPEAVTVLLGTDVLETVIKAARSVRNGAHGSIAFEIRNGELPVKFAVDGSDGLALDGLAMPMRAKSR